MSPRKIYDIIGIGIGPFNLGLAALCYSIPGLQCLFIDQNEGFNWHPGLMIEGARLQVPFYADLVSLADPCSPFSFMAFLKSMKRMFRFAIHENYFITRREYNDYGKWVAAQLPSLRFNQTCRAIRQTTGGYMVITDSDVFYTKNIVLGTGTVPSMPNFASNLQDPLVFHSSGYISKRKKLLEQSSVTVVGSGQSAAEIFYDLLSARKHFTNGLNWVTRSERFTPMDYSKLTLEMSAPDYIDHFYSLDQKTKSSVLTNQQALFKASIFL